ncbi:MAG TPA: type II toxin-antitoxin system VapC family toxin [Methylomirabilota bacterium]|nr:type II toxin-antitoxin system VapC family toxin [Methylomirabilota bacterium]
MLVVDASVAVHASLAADGFALLRGETLAAPALLWSEVPSVLHELAWRGSVSRQLAREALARFLAASVVPRRPSRLTSQAWDIADRFGWAKTYDAEYVALAHLLRCRLLTLDARLRRSASGLIEVVGPSEL